MENLRMNNYQWKGDKFDLEILQNMLDLWSPYITLEEIKMAKRKTPSHDITVSYDFEPLKKEYDDAKLIYGDSQGFSLNYLGW